MRTLNLLAIALFAIGLVTALPADAHAQPGRIPGRSDNFGIPSHPGIPAMPGFNSPPGFPSSPRTPSIPNIPSFSGDLPGSIGRSRDIPGLPEYEFTCSNCDRVIATGTSRFSADHISKCPHCGVRFTNTSVSTLPDDPFANQRSNASSNLPSRSNQGTGGQQARMQSEIGLIIVAGIGFFLSILLIVGGIVFFIIKESTKKNNRYSAYGQSPYGGSTYQPPSQPSQPWNNPYKRS